MSRSSNEESSKRGKLRALPWAALLRGGVVVGRRWRKLSEKERARLAQLLRDSRGRPRNLAPKQRKELRSLLVKLDIRGMGEELLPLIRGRRGGRRCHRRRKSA